MDHPGENSVLAFVEGRLDVAQASALDAHIDTCEPCRALVVATARASLATGTTGGEAEHPPSRGVAPLERGAQLGRYTLLKVLGRGGMGIVYSAHDSALDRKVAVKVLRGEVAARVGADIASARLLREARIAAQLSHPNVVTIHDVDSYGGQIFIAMEYVDGQPLSAWLKEGPHPASVILERFVQAGRGLAAAHVAGLVHRDFKPANVLVGKDGRVRVTDFGLAGWMGEDASGNPAGEVPITSTITMAGRILGTPLYMAPEQHRGERAGPLADQFSFGVALYEALYRRGTFEGKTLDELAASKARGPVEPPGGGGVPARVRRALLRALRPRQEERFASLDALLAELDRDWGAPRRWALLGAGMLALLALGAFGARALGTPPSQVCAGGEQRLVGVWDDGRKRAIHDAFLATRAPYAEDASRMSAAILDEYTRAWVEARKDACEATQVRREQLEAHQALRMMCLDERLEEVKALGAFFTRADMGVVEHAVEAAHALRPLSLCADIKALSAKVPPPADPVVRAKVEALGIKVAEIQALAHAGKYAEALEAAEAARTEAKATGYQPLEAQLGVLQGEAAGKMGDAKAAEQLLKRAVLAAEASRDEVTAARAWTSLVHAVGHGAVRYDEALALWEYAHAAIVRLGGANPEMARLLVVRSSLQYGKGDYDASLKDTREALEIQLRLLPEDHPDIAETLNALGNAFSGLGRYDEAREPSERALAIREKAFGPKHPKVAVTLYNLGLDLDLNGKMNEAEPYYQRALGIMEQPGLTEHILAPKVLSALGTLALGRGDYERAVVMNDRARALAEKIDGPEHPSVAEALAALGFSLSRQGRLDEALAALQRARAIDEKAFGPAHPHHALILAGLGEVLASKKQYAASRDSFERAMASHIKALGPDHIVIADDLDASGRALSQEGRYADALSAHRKALALYERRLGADNPYLSSTLSNIADALVRLRRYAEALPMAERALAVYEKNQGAEHPEVALALCAIGVASFHLGRFEAAIPPLERAVKLREYGSNREALVKARRYLARARAEAARSKGRASPLP